MSSEKTRKRGEPATPSARSAHQGNAEDIAYVFAPDGAVARLLGDRYRPRRGQARMARLVRLAVADRKHALIEAGTGSGKSFAYLVPLIWDGTRAFIATANKTLQTQLWEKDLPELRRIAPRPFSAALLKGRSNYVCRLKLDEQRLRPSLPGLVPDLDQLIETLSRDVNHSGDTESLRLPFELRDAVTVGRHDCLGRRCPAVRQCYYEQAVLAAEEADLVVLNHSLLAFHLAIDPPFLTPRDVVVVDEAHELPAYVTGALRVSLDYNAIPGLINEPVLEKHAQPATRARAVQANHALFGALAEQGQVWESRWAVAGELQDALALADHLAELRRQLLRQYPPSPGGDDNEQNAHYRRIMEWVDGVTTAVRQLAKDPPEGSVRYGEGASSRERASLHLEPLDVAGFLAEKLFETTPTVICTSATLTTHGRFNYFAGQVGAPPECLTRVIPSPFDFASQMLIYTPRGLEPRYDAEEQGYVENLTDEVERLVRASRGRAFVLCTSTRRMQALYEALDGRLPYQCLRQGLMSRGALLELFRDSGNAVLFGTRSFWQGVDVPGEALSLVILDKLPFAPPSDPVIAKRAAQIEARGGNPFLELALPDAILILKQGTGRLIRTETDRGVIALLDSRLLTRRYGRQILASLPPARHTRLFSDVVKFFPAPEG
jgi:Rad3-related DNA helicase